MSTIKIVTVGQNGRMNQALRACLPKHPNLKCDGDLQMGCSLNLLCRQVGNAGAVLDFSEPNLTQAVLEVCACTAKPLVLGTTGHSTEERAQIQKYARKFPIVFSSNFSTGVNVLFGLLRTAATILGEGFDLEVVEMHHRRKKDAPSGTALALAKVLEDVRSGAVLQHGRHGQAIRNSKEIGMHAIRGGSVFGDHTIIFAGEGERVELVHKVDSREAFADGALRAAKWVVGKPPGLYDMQDVLGLR